MSWSVLVQSSACRIPFVAGLVFDFMRRGLAIVSLLLTDFGRKVVIRRMPLRVRDVGCRQAQNGGKKEPSRDGSHTVSFCILPSEEGETRRQ
jgi:hypothetical protein